MKDLVLIGGGGHCKSCIDVIEMAGEFRIAGIVDRPEKLHHKVMGYEIIASDKDLPDLIKIYRCFFITMGFIKKPDRRVEIFNLLKKSNAEMPIIISPLSHVSKHARVGEGTGIMHHALINAGAVVGKNCIINTKALIEHDTIIGDNCHISTGAVINGGTIIERETFVGSNAICRENIKVGKKSVIGLNTSIIKGLSEKSIIQ